MVDFLGGEFWIINFYFEGTTGPIEVSIRPLNGRQAHWSHQVDFSIIVWAPS
jgi:hypothetical protein